MLLLILLIVVVLLFLLPIDVQLLATKRAVRVRFSLSVRIARICFLKRNGHLVMGTQKLLFQTKHARHHVGARRRQAYSAVWKQLRRNDLFQNRDLVLLMRRALFFPRLTLNIWLGVGDAAFTAFLVGFSYFLTSQVTAVARQYLRLGQISFSYTPDFNAIRVDGRFSCIARTRLAKLIAGALWLLMRRVRHRQERGRMWRWPWKNGKSRLFTILSKP